MAALVFELGSAHPGGFALATAEHALANLGPGYWRAVERQVGATILADCADGRGLALAALRAGLRRLVFSGPAAVAVKLETMARQLGGTVVPALPQPVLVLPTGLSDRRLRTVILGYARLGERPGAV